MYTPRGKPAAVAKTLTTESAPLSQAAVRAVASTVMSKPLYRDHIGMSEQGVSRRTTHKSQTPDSIMVNQNTLYGSIISLHILPLLPYCLFLLLQQLLLLSIPVLDNSESFAKH